jgi:hypothetical protein
MPAVTYAFDFFAFFFFFAMVASSVLVVLDMPNAEFGPGRPSLKAKSALRASSSPASYAFDFFAFFFFFAMIDPSFARVRDGRV